MHTDAWLILATLKIDMYRVQNNSWSLVIFQPILIFDQSKLTLVGHIYVLYICNGVIKCNFL